MRKYFLWIGAEFKKIQLFFALAAGIFFLGVVQGLVVAATEPERVAELLSGLEILVEFFESLSAFQLSAAIFVNNLVKSFVAMIGGVLFGIVPVFYLWSNGQVLGLVAELAAQDGLSPTLIITSLAPHGVFELGAFFLANALGLQLARKTFRRLRYKEPLKVHVTHAVKVFVNVVAPLLLIAALVEAYVTPIFMNAAS